MDEEEMKQRIEELEAKNADISRNFAAHRKLSEERENELTKQLETTQKESEKTIAEKEKALETLNKSIEAEKNTRKSNFMEKKLAEMSKGDEKVLEALKAEYAIINLPDDTEEGISARLDKAKAIYTATTSTTTSASEAAGAGSGSGGGSNQGGGEAPSANVAAMLAASGVTV
jgi:septal ring factor EnvC (AmiA/AmiB activator)